MLAIAGSDSGGGAGVQADIKTITALGGYAATAITAVTVQDTLGVHAIHPVPPPIVAAQIRAVLDDIGADAIKTGMLGDAATVEAVLAALADWPGHPAGRRSGDGRHRRRGAARAGRAGRRCGALIARAASSPPTRPRPRR